MLVVFIALESINLFHNRSQAQHTFEPKLISDSHNQHKILKLKVEKIKKKKCSTLKPLRYNLHKKGSDQYTDQNVLKTIKKQITI